MLVRLIGSASFAVIALIVITVVFVNREEQPEPVPVDESALPDRGSVSSVAPALAPAIPLRADRMNGAEEAPRLEEGVLLKVSDVQPVSSRVRSESNAPPAISSQRPSAFTTLPLLSRTAATSLELQEFAPLIGSEKFYRPKWQDFNYDINATFKHGTADPFVVMIDPGHGGTDPGSIGYNGLVEKELTLDIARRVRLFLTEFADIDVQLTRNYDHGLSRQSRVSAIQRSNADMVISLHFNNLPQDDVNLVETYFAGPANIVESLIKHRNSEPLHHTSNMKMTELDLGFASGSARLAHSLHQRMLSEVSFKDDEVFDAGVKEETLFVLTRSFTPAVLIEISCLSNDDEADRLATNEYRNRLAAALVDGIRDYYYSVKSDPVGGQIDLGA